MGSWPINNPQAPPIPLSQRRDASRRDAVKWHAVRSIVNRVALENVAGSNNRGEMFLEALPEKVGKLFGLTKIFLLTRLRNSPCE